MANTIEHLADRKCVPCQGGQPPLTRERALQFLTQVPGWQLQDNAKQIARTYVMKNFVVAVNFIDKVAAIAEKEGHHPDIHLTGYRNLTIELSTHKIGGLSESDFILAAKINLLPAELKTS